MATQEVREVASSSALALPWPTIQISDPQPPLEGGRPFRQVSYPERYRAQHLVLLETARDVAELRGYSATQISEIVAKAACSRRTFYEHFGSKEGCFSEILLRASASGLSRWCHAAETEIANGPQRTMLAILESYRTMYDVPDALPISGRLSTGLWSEAHVPDSPLAETLDIVTTAGARLFFVAGRRLGSSLTDAELQMAARVIFSGTIEFFNAQWVADRPMNVETLAATIVRALGCPDK